MARWCRGVRGFTECSASGVARALTDFGAVPGRKKDGRVTGSTHTGTGLSTHHTGSADARRADTAAMQRRGR